MEADLLYYRRRLAEEKAAAEVANDVRARKIHLELARAYDKRIVLLDAEHLRANFRLVPAD